MSMSVGGGMAWMEYNPISVAAPGSPLLYLKEQHVGPVYIHSFPDLIRQIVI